MLVEERGLSSKPTQDVRKDRRLGNLSTPIRVQKLQRALHAKAKAEPDFRFYALYDKIYREDILAHAYAQCRSNKGAPGVDRQDFVEIEAYGVERWLGGTGTTALVSKLNRMLRGWANYFQVGTVSRAYRAIDSYTTMRLSQWLRNKYRVRCSGYRTYPDKYLYETLGLVRLTRLGCDVPWVKA